MAKHRSWIKTSAPLWLKIGAKIVIFALASVLWFLEEASLVRTRRYGRSSKSVRTFVGHATTAGVSTGWRFPA